MPLCVLIVFFFKCMLIHLIFSLQKGQIGSPFTLNQESTLAPSSHSETWLEWYLVVVFDSICSFKLLCNRFFLTPPCFLDSRGLNPPPNRIDLISMWPWTSESYYPSHCPMMDLSLTNLAAPLIFPFSSASPGGHTCPCTGTGTCRSVHLSCDTHGHHAKGIAEPSPAQNSPGKSMGASGKN